MTVGSYSRNFGVNRTHSLVNRNKLVYKLNISDLFELFPKHLLLVCIIQNRFIVCIFSKKFTILKRVLKSVFVSQNYILV